MITCCRPFSEPVSWTFKFCWDLIFMPVRESIVCFICLFIYSFIHSKNGFGICPVTVWRNRIANKYAFSQLAARHVHLVSWNVSSDVSLVLKVNDYKNRFSGSLSLSLSQIPYLKAAYTLIWMELSRAGSFHSGAFAPLSWVIKRYCGVFQTELALWTTPAFAELSGFLCFCKSSYGNWWTQQWWDSALVFLVGEVGDACPIDRNTELTGYTWK